jgi:hypothetical protein
MTKAGIVKGAGLFYTPFYKLFFLFTYFFYIQSEQFNTNQSLQP